MEECMIIVLAIATYLLFNVVLTMLMLEDKPLEHRISTTIILILFGLPIIVMVIIVAVVIFIVEAFLGGIK